MRKKQILVIIKRPGRPPELEPFFENKLEASREAVSGRIEALLRLFKEQTD